MPVIYSNNVFLSLGITIYKWSSHLPLTDALNIILHLFYSVILKDLYIYLGVTVFTEKDESQA